MDHHAWQWSNSSGQAAAAATSAAANHARPLVSRPAGASSAASAHSSLRDGMMEECKEDMRAIDGDGSSSSSSPSDADDEDEADGRTHQRHHRRPRSAHITPVEQRRRSGRESRQPEHFVPSHASQAASASAAAAAAASAASPSASDSLSASDEDGAHRSATPAASSVSGASAAEEPEGSMTSSQSDSGSESDCGEANPYDPRLRQSDRRNLVREQQMKAQIRSGLFRRTEGWPRMFNGQLWTAKSREPFGTCWRCTKETNDDGSPKDLLQCDGVCQRAFHPECVGRHSLPESRKWYCPQCADGSFPRVMKAEPGSHRVASSNCNDPLQRTQLMCALEDHPLRFGEGEFTREKQLADVLEDSYLYYLLHTPGPAERHVRKTINRKDKEKDRNYTALHYALTHCRSLPAGVSNVEAPLMLRLIQLGADPNARSGDLDYGATPAHFAMQRQTMDSILPLLTSPKINLKAKCGSRSVLSDGKINDANRELGTPDWLKNQWPICFVFVVLFSYAETLLQRNLYGADEAFLKSRLIAGSTPDALQFAWLAQRRDPALDGSGLARKDEAERKASTRAAFTRSFAEQEGDAGAGGAAAAAASAGRSKPSSLSKQIIDSLFRSVRMSHMRRGHDFPPALTRVMDGIAEWRRWTDAFHPPNTRAMRWVMPDVKREDGQREGGQAAVQRIIPPPPPPRTTRAYKPTQVAHVSLGTDAESSPPVHEVVSTVASDVPAAHSKRRAQDHSAGNASSAKRSRGAAAGRDGSSLLSRMAAASSAAVAAYSSASQLSRVSIPVSRALSPRSVKRPAPRSTSPLTLPLRHDTSQPAAKRSRPSSPSSPPTRHHSPVPLARPASSRVSAAYVAPQFRPSGSSEHLPPPYAHAHTQAQPAAASGAPAAPALVTPLAASMFSPPLGPLSPISSQSVAAAASHLAACQVHSVPVSPATPAVSRLAPLLFDACRSLLDSVMLACDNSESLLRLNTRPLLLQQFDTNESLLADIVSMQARLKRETPSLDSDAAVRALAPHFAHSGLARLWCTDQMAFYVRECANAQRQLSARQQTLTVTLQNSAGSDVEAAADGHARATAPAAQADGMADDDDDHIPDPAVNWGSTATPLQSIESRKTR